MGGCWLNRLVIQLTSCRRVSCYRLKDDQFVCRNLQGLLERGVQKAMDPTEPKGPVDPSAPPLAIETMLGYTGAVCRKKPRPIIIDRNYNYVFSG